jgi:hypothetical protein
MTSRSTLVSGGRPRGDFAPRVLRGLWLPGIVIEVSRKLQSQVKAYKLRSDNCGKKKLENYPKSPEMLTYRIPPKIQSQVTNSNQSRQQVS